ncbi:MAG: hypothetical protein ABIZ04_21190 [Opitutus sp.]
MSDGPTPPNGSPKTRNVSELLLRRYADTINGHEILCDPTPEDIRDAIKSGNPETRNYQSDLEALKSEWIAQCQASLSSFEEWKRVVTRYHAGRIAYFVENGWDHPVTIKSNGEVTDGTHRAKAAIFKGQKEILVTVES